MRWREMFSTVDAHVGGQPLRLITFGTPRLTSTNLREQVIEMQEKHDQVRSWLLAEPRGHAGMTGAILVPSVQPDIDYGVIFMSSGGYKPMSGHGVIGLATTLIESGTVPVDGPDTRINFETLAGPIQARASVDNGNVRSVRFRNVPSFRTHRALEVNFEGRVVHADVAYGGNWYAIVRAEELGIELETDKALSIKLAGQAISKAVSEQVQPAHPDNPELAGIFGTVILGTPMNDEASNRNATVYLNGLIDRSPCGTGMSATMACLAADEDLQVGQPYISESIIGSTMTGRITTTTNVGDYPAIITEIAGRGQVTGMHQFFIDPADPIGQGFVLT